MSIRRGAVGPDPRSGPGGDAALGRIRRLGLLGCLGLASCSKADGSGSQPTPADPVVVSGRIICHQASGDVDLAFPPAVGQALFLGEDGTSYHVVVPRSGSNNQVMLDIPEGVRYLLQVDTSYFETDQRTVDISTEVVRRCMPAPPTGQVSRRSS